MVQARIIIKSSPGLRRVREVVRTGAARFTPEAIIRTEADLHTQNKQTTPVGETGKLKESFFTARKPNTITFGWNAPYAKYVDEGSEPSPGRYIPAIGKRYRNDAGAMRERVLKRALKHPRREGLTHAQVKKMSKHIRTTPIITGKRAEEELDVYKAFGIIAYGMHKQEKGTTRRGKIYVRPGSPGGGIAMTRTHELWHVAQTMLAKGRPDEGYTKGYEPWGKEAEAERETENILRAIGEHPGTKPQHISQKMMDFAVEAAKDNTIATIRKAITGGNA